MAKKTEYYENYELSKELEYYDTFDHVSLGLSNEILQGIYAYGYETPSPIQRVAIKPIIDRNDIVIQSHSGTGKTAAFIIGMLQNIDNSIQKPQCIIISNSRELAVQTYNVFEKISLYSNTKCNLCIGGDMQYKYNVENIKEQVIVGTPGRIGDLIGKKIINGKDIKIIIIDEADDVLSSSFRKQVKMIFQSIDENAQVVLVSATIPPEMSALFNNLLKPGYLSILVKDDELTLDGITQYYVSLDDSYKTGTLIDLYKYVSVGQGIVYCNRKNKVDELKEELMNKDFSVSVLHGDMMQKEREMIMKDYRSGATRILITTDVLSRGIDIQQVSLVINYDMPKYPQTYIHRIGRSGRFGRKGVAINFVSKKEMNILDYIQKMYNTEILSLPADVSALL